MCTQSGVKRDAILSYLSHFDFVFDISKSGFPIFGKDISGCNFPRGAKEPNGPRGQVFICCAYGGCETAVSHGPHAGDALGVLLGHRGIGSSAFRAPLVAPPPRVSGGLGECLAEG